MLKINRTNSENPDFRSLIKQLDADLNSRYGIIQEAYDKHNKIERIDTVVIAYYYNKPVGCACFKEFSANTVEVKRMFVNEGLRGKKIGTQLLSELEAWATELNYLSAVLETGKQQPEAIALYRKSGYDIIENYGQYKGMKNSICMSKQLKSSYKQ